MDDDSRLALRIKCQQFKNFNNFNDNPLEKPPPGCMGGGKKPKVVKRISTTTKPKSAKKQTILKRKK